MSFKRKRSRMNLIKVENGTALLDPDVSLRIASFERQAKAIKEMEDELKAAILEEMEANGILKVETVDLSITYIAPTDRETFDSKRLRADNPDLYDEYAKFSHVRSSIRIRVK